jgi:hypothetical protein
MIGNRALDNRPQKFGPQDRREHIVQDSEVSMICVNNTAGSPIYVGRAKAGTALSEAKWQIRHLEYDANGGVTRVTWPVNNINAASTNYEFVWETLTTHTITGITQANPAVVTVSSITGLVNGQLIVISGVAGMTQVNFNGSNIYTVAGIAGSTFQLSGINSTGYGAYTSGGTVDIGSYLTYTYA